MPDFARMIDELQYSVIVLIAGIHWSPQEALLMTGYTVKLVNVRLIKNAFMPIITQTKITWDDVEDTVRDHAVSMAWSLLLFALVEQIVHLLITIAMGITFVSFGVAILFAFFKRTESIAHSSINQWIELIAQTIIIALIQALVERLQDATRYRHAPEMDVFANVNALARGWSQYYCYANDSKHKLSRLTGIVYWLTAHYLGRKHNLSIRQMMRTHYGRDPKTGQLALYTLKPDGKPLFIWNKYPTHRSILSPGGTADDLKPCINTN